MIGVIVAMEEELLPIINHPAIMAKPKGRLGKRPVFTTHFRGKGVDDTLVFILSGIGRSNAAAATASLIDLGARAIFNVGTCGCTFKEQVVTPENRRFTPQRGDVWVPTEICDGEFDLSVFTGKKDIDPVGIWKDLKDTPNKGVIRLLTVNHFSTTPLADYPYLVDMEAYDIVSVCSALNCFVRVVKVISDSASEGEEKTFDKNLPGVMQVAADQIVKEIEDYIVLLHGGRRQEKPQPAPTAEKKDS